jgi:hypothetical protein
MFISKTIQNGNSFSIAYTYDSLQGMMHFTKKGGFRKSLSGFVRKTFQDQEALYTE